MHKDLLQQARTLAKIDTGKPKQANLRRAVSAAYYSLFHMLVNEACRGIIGTQHSQQGFRQALARAFVHGTMKNACNSFAGSQLPASVSKALPQPFVISKAIINISRTFKELQDKRHSADYDLSERFQRSEVLTLIRELSDHMDEFANLPASDERQFFLVCLLSWKELGNR